jgi:hypothetical protein
MSWVQDPPLGEPPSRPQTPFPEPPANPIIPSPPGISTPESVGSDEAPTTRRSRIRVVVGSVAAIAVIAAVAGGIAVSRRSSHASKDVSFATPRGWREFPQASFRAQEGAPIGARTVGIDSANVVVIQTYLLSTKVDSGNLEQIRAEIDSLVHRLTTETGSLGTLPGFQYQISTYDPTGSPVESRIVFAFINHTEYFMNCQHTAAHAAEIEAGCDQISQTFVSD